MNSLDPVIHSQARLKIMSTICGFSDLTNINFVKLQELTNLSSGNLSTHLTKLEEAGYIKQTKKFKGKSPQTIVSVTEEGQVAYKKYIIELKKMINF